MHKEILATSNDIASYVMSITLNDLRELVSEKPNSGNKFGKHLYNFGVLNQKL